MFIKTDNQNNIVTYPYSLEQFKQENTNTSLPRFLNNRFLATKNVLPVYEDIKPEYDNIANRLVQHSRPTKTGGTWLIGWNVVAKTEDQVTSDFNIEKNKLRQKINELREAHIYQQYTVNVSETVAIPVDIRKEERDLSNISNLVLAATLKKIVGDTSTITFRDANNTNHLLLPAEVIFLGTIISGMVTDTYIQSWYKKELISAATDAYKLREIDITFTKYVHV
tara:strand:+ start:2603 stop:3274 length:672 start_codon:yes stop_codon:yes gene_type:complete